jgi:acyl-coenzyme A thioesterase PaaI-like protein
MDQEMLDTIMARTVAEGTLAGRTLATYDIVVTDAGGHRVCTSRLTCLIRDHAHGLDLNGAGELDKR